VPKFPKDLEKLWTHDESLWQRINCDFRTFISEKFLEQVIGKGCTHLSLRGASLYFSKLNLKQSASKLKSLDLQSAENTRVINEIISTCYCLEKLSLAKTRGHNIINFKYICQSAQTLQVLNLNSYAHYGRQVSFESMQYIVERCFKLTELNLDTDFSRFSLSQESISFLCNNLTPTIRKLSLRKQNIKAEDVQALVTRCDKITELNICSSKISETNEITNKVSYIVEKLSNTLVKLGINYVTDDILKKLQSMAKLKYLAVRYKHPTGTGEGRDSFRHWQEEKNKQYPNIIIIRCVRKCPFRIGFFQDRSINVDCVDDATDSDSDVDPDENTGFNIRGLPIELV